MPIVVIIQHSNVIRAGEAVDVSVPVADAVTVVVDELDCAMTVDNVADAVSMAEIKRRKEENIAGGQEQVRTTISFVISRAR